MVEDHPIGPLDGFRFTVARRCARGATSACCSRRPRSGWAASCARRAAGAGRCAGRRDSRCDRCGRPVAIVWSGPCRSRGSAPGAVARAAARSCSTARSTALDRAGARRGRRRGSTRWLAAQLERALAGAGRSSTRSLRDPAAPPALRAVAGALLGGGRRSPRAPMRPALDALDPPARKRLRAIGHHDRHARPVRARAAQARAGALAARAAAARGDGAAPPRARPCCRAARRAPTRRTASARSGTQAVRVDLVERIARAAHDARAGGRTPFAPDPGARDLDRARARRRSRG